MALQATVGNSALIGIGISVGDVATLINVGNRLGNWFTAHKTDADFLATLEEPESDILRRRGILDITRFNQRWGVRLHLLENGRAQRREGTNVEHLLQKSSLWTTVMTCITAVLDEFANDTTVRAILRALLHRLFSTEESEVSRDLINSSIRERVNSWRSAATVREMNLACRRIRQELLDKRLIVPGHIPKGDAPETVEFLFWLLCGEDGEYCTSSSDLAAIACCLCRLSFEILSVGGFDPIYSSRETTCRLTYIDAPVSQLHRHHNTNIRHQALRARCPSTTVLLAQPEEAFSTFPITSDLANRARGAWKLGSIAASTVHLGVDVGDHETVGASTCDIQYMLRNEGTPTTSQDRTSSAIYFMASEYFVFATNEVIGGLERVLSKYKSLTLDRVASSEGQLYTERGWNDEEAVAECFTTFQAFHMGYWYRLLNTIVDASNLDVATVSGCWGYHSEELLTKIRRLISRMHREGPEGISKDEAIIRRSQMLYLLGLLFANEDRPIPEGDLIGSPHDAEVCVGIIGKRTILANSLLHDCHSPDDIGKFVILDCDVGGIPHTGDGLVLTGIPSILPMYEYDHDGPEKEAASIRLSEVTLAKQEVGCTRHIDVDWEGGLDRMLLCIRFNGRRIGTVHPGYADKTFVDVWKEQPTSKNPASPSPFGLAWEWKPEDMVRTGMLLNPEHGAGATSIPIVVQSIGDPSLRYAVTAWYAAASNLHQIVFVQRSLGEATSSFENLEGLLLIIIG